MDWQKHISKAMVLRGFLAFLWLNSSVFAGIMYALGWEFFPIIDKYHILTLTTSALLIIFISLLILVNFTLAITRILTLNTTNSSNSALTIFIRKVFFQSTALHTILWSIMISILWYVFFPKESDIEYESVYLVFTSSLLFLIVGFFSAILPILETNGNTEEHKVAVPFGIALMLTGGLSLGTSWVKYNQISPKTVLITLENKSKNKTIPANILFIAEQGMLVYQGTMVRPTYLSWSNIRKMEVIKKDKPNKDK